MKIKEAMPGQAVQPVCLYVLCCMLFITVPRVMWAQTPDSLQAGADVHPDSLMTDSMLLQSSGGMMAPMALPSPPYISYTVPASLQLGVAVSYSPANTGGAVYADWDLTTFAGSSQGYTNGTGTAAQFYYPSGIVSDGAGNLYVSEGRNHVIRKITPNGEVSTFAGSGAAGSANGTGTAASFNYTVTAHNAGGSFPFADCFALANALSIPSLMK